MTKTFKTVLLALTAGGLLAAPALARENVSGEAKLAKMLEGRVAGEPESCVRTFPSGNMTIIDGTALVYKQGSTLWVNIPAQPRSLDDGDGLLTRPFGNRICRTDIVTTFDRSAGFYTGNIMLGDFVPYRKAS